MPNASLWTPGEVDTRQLSAAEREAARVALNEHVELLTQKHNALTSAVAALIAWQGQHSDEALESTATIDTLTASLAGTNVQVAAILDRLTALDSHEDRIEDVVAWQQRHGASIDRIERHIKTHEPLALARIDALERAAAVANTRTVWQRIRSVFAR